MAKTNFLKRVHHTPKMKALKERRKKLDAKRKKLAAEYKRIFKLEAARLGRQYKGDKKGTAKHRGAGSFLKSVYNTPRMKRIKVRQHNLEIEHKKLVAVRKKAFASEAARLSKELSKKKRKPVSKKSKKKSKK